MRRKFSDIFMTVKQDPCEFCNNENGKICIDCLKQITYCAIKDGIHDMESVIEDAVLIGIREAMDDKANAPEDAA
jgi:hypothetical protein